MALDRLEINMPTIRFPSQTNGHDEFQYLHLVDRARGGGTAKAQADVFAFIVSQADAFQFCYDYLGVVAEERLLRGHSPVRVPTLIEFIELLEFRESELLRTETASGEDLYWQWPGTWPDKPSWNSHVSHALSDLEGALVEPAKHRDYMLATTRRGIQLNKILAGHGASALVDYVSALLMSRLLNVVVSGREPAERIPIQPRILRSLDLPTSARVVRTNEEHARWRIDGVLGDYKDDEIRIHERAISRCSDDTGIDRQSLFRVVLLHEAAHHYLPQGLDDVLGEALAQLLVYLSLRDMGTPNHELDAFQALLPHQPSEYRKHEDLLSVSADSQRVADVVRGLQDRKDGTSYAEFRAKLWGAV